MKNTYRLFYAKLKYMNLFSLFILTSFILHTAKMAHAMEPIPIGSSSFTMPFMGHDISVETFRPSTYVDQPLLIVMPGVVRSATNARNDAILLAAKYSCLVAVPHLSTEHFPTAADYDHGDLWP